MKFKANEEEFYELSDLRKKVICNDIPSDIVEDDIKRRMKYVIEHKYEQCMKRLKAEWMPKLTEAGIKSVPLDDDAFAELVFNRPEYKDRTARELEEGED